MNSFQKLTYWMPRVLGIMIVLFISLFALDSPYNTNVLTDFATMAAHLAPTAIVLVILVLAWRWEWIGILSYAALGILYSIKTSNHPDWILVIAGPLFLCAALFGLSLYSRRRQLSVN